MSVITVFLAAFGSLLVFLAFGAKHHVDECANTQKMIEKCFNDLPPDLKEFLHSTMLFIKNEDVVAKCDVFNQAVTCFDAFPVHCVQHQKYNIVINNIDATRKLMNKICSDKDVQQAIQKEEVRKHLDGCEDTQNKINYCFKDVPRHLMDYFQSTEIGTSKRVVIINCDFFYDAMKCFDAISLRCLQTEKHKFLYDKISRIRKRINKTCSDDDYQRDYRHHIDCIKYIQDDWSGCISEFDNKLTNVNQVQSLIIDGFTEFCCARFDYEKCIYKSARSKCYQNSTEDALHLAKMLSYEKHFASCRQFEMDCILVECITLVWRIIFFFVLALMVCYMRNRTD